MNVCECPIKKVLTAHENDSVLEVAKILRDTQHRHLVVMDSTGKPTGFMSVVDVNNRVVAEERDPRHVLAKDIMSKNLITIDEKTAVEEAIEIMTSKNILSCPITKNGQLVGLCEIKDLVHHLQKKKFEELS